MEEVQQTDETDFFCIPPEVIDGYILPHLGWNDLLRLRRVCTWAQVVVYGFMRRHPEMCPELEINQDDKTIGDFLKMGISTTRIFLNVTGEKFYRRTGKERLNEFQERYGPLVKHLRTTDLSPIINGKELFFLSSLLNLETLEVKSFEVIFDGTDNIPPPPKVFKYIRRCPIRSNSCAISLNQWSVELTGSTEKTHLTLEVDHTGLQNDNFPVEGGFDFGWTFECIRASLDGIMCEGGFNAVNSADMDLFVLIDKQMHRSCLPSGSPDFEWLCDACDRHKVNMYNVGADWFPYYGPWADGIPELYKPHLGTFVRSLVNLHPGALKKEMRNLEKIEIRSSHHSNPGFPRLPDVVRPAWPNLKILDITVDSEICDFYEHNPRQTDQNSSSVKIIFDFFFKDVSRPALTELQLKFTDEASPDIVPKTEDIIKSCPNLKKLTLVGWLGSNLALTKLWHGLSALEEVSFENCKYLGNGAFIGEDYGNPAFLELASLKKLSLKGLDMMPKVTDSLFSLVIRHMPLTHLTLTSSLPLKSVTMTGIRSLLAGEFAESVEKFHFEDWSLANVSSKKWTQLKSKFRSSRML